MTKREIIRDKNNTAIGYLETDSFNGKQTLRNANNTFIGSYDPKDNVTRDGRHNWVGKGNLLMTLLR